MQGALWGRESAKNCDTMLAGVARLVANSLSEKGGEVSEH